MESGVELEHVRVVWQEDQDVQDSSWKLNHAI